MSRLGRAARLQQRFPADEALVEADRQPKPISKGEYFCEGMSAFPRSIIDSKE
jgi:hypothetical protein